MVEEEQIQPLLGKHSRSMSVESSDQSESGSPQSHEYFPANKLFEYQWPLGDNGAEHCMLQEQVKEYLDIRGIQRKYPDLNRRTLDIDERKYLVGRGVVTETQSNMGLVAMKSDEVLELMAEEYPKKYEEYMNVVQEREFQAALRRKMMEARRVSLMADATNEDVTREAVQLTVEYNTRLAEQRRTLRKEYLDTQTNISHVPRKPLVVCEPPEQGRYPVALLPGQYCDHYYKYTAQELNRLPLKTVMELPASVNSQTPPESTSSVIPTMAPIPISAAPSNTLLQHSQQQSPALSLVLRPSAQLPSNKSTPSSQLSNRSTPLIQFSNKSTPSNTSTVGNIAAQLFSMQQAKLPTSNTSTETHSNTQSKSIINSHATTLLPTQSKPLHATGQVIAQVLSSAQTMKALSTSTLASFSSTHSPTVRDSTSSSVSGKMATGKTGNGEPASSLSNMSSQAGMKRSSVTSSSSSSLGVPQTQYPLRKPGLRTGTQCSVCFKGTNKKRETEKIVHCTQCGNGVHPSCYNLTDPATSVIRTYQWQCLECKTCQVCNDPGNEEKMVCCDECDRGYHSFCVGLDDIPSGDWLCGVCGSCKSCGAKSLGSGPDSKWKHEYIGTRFVQTLCVECSSYFRRGYFCPLCLKVYHDDETDSPMVCCDNCDRWIHTECDDISEERYKELSNEKENSSYFCQLCRGEAEEIVDTFHKKNRQ